MTEPTEPSLTVAEFEEFRNTLLLGYGMITAYLDADTHADYDAIVKSTPADELIYALCMAACAIANTLTGPHDDDGEDCTCPRSSAEVIANLRQQLIGSTIEDWQL